MDAADRQTAPVEPQRDGEVLAAKTAALTAMAIGIAHDYNNLLAAVLGNASILLRNLPPDSPVMDNARLIEDTALRALELTNHILLYSGRSKTSHDVFDCVSLLRDMASQLRVTVGREIELVYALDEDLPRLCGDATQVRRAIVNLVTNASEAMADEPGTITVACGSMECDDELLARGAVSPPPPAGRYAFVRVADNGPGMSPAIMARIFDPFFTTRIRGHGMGLPVALGTARGHKGTILVESAEAKGSSFTLLLPIESPDGE